MAGSEAGGRTCISILPCCTADIIKKEALTDRVEKHLGAVVELRKAAEDDLRVGKLKASTKMSVAKWCYNMVHNTTPIGLTDSLIAGIFVLLHSSNRKRQGVEGNGRGEGEGGGGGGGRRHGYETRTRD